MQFNDWLLVTLYRCAAITTVQCRTFHLPKDYRKSLCSLSALPPRGLGSHWYAFHLCKFLFLAITHKWNHAICNLLHQHVFTVHSYYGMHQYFIPFYCKIVFYHINEYFTFCYCLLEIWIVSGLGYYEFCCYEQYI